VNAMSKACFRLRFMNIFISLEAAQRKTNTNTKNTKTNTKY